MGNEPLRMGDHLRNLALLLAVGVAWGVVGPVQLSDDDVNPSALEMADSLLDFRRVFDKLALRGKSEDLGEGRGAPRKGALERLLSKSCAAHANAGYYDSSSCDALSAGGRSLLKSMITALKSREAEGRPLSFQEYGKLETFYAISSMSELTQLTQEENSKKLTPSAHKKLQEREQRILNTFHAETERAEEVHPKDRHTKAPTQASHSSTKPVVSVPEPAGQDLVKQFEYSTWSNPAAAKAEAKEAQDGHPHQLEKGTGEKLDSQKFLRKFEQSVLHVPQ